MQTAFIDPLNSPRRQDTDDEWLRATRRSFDRTTRISAPRRLALSEPDDFDLEVDQTVNRRPRLIAVRLLGGLAVLGSIVGLSEIARHDGARHAVVEWGTMGHSQEVGDAQRAISRVWE